MKKLSRNPFTDSIIFGLQNDLIHKIANLNYFHSNNVGSLTTVPGLHVGLEVLDAAVEGGHVAEHDGAHKVLLVGNRAAFWGGKFR